MTGHVPREAQTAPAGIGDLLVVADTLDDLERARIAIGSRHQALTASEVEGPNGGRYGKGIPASTPEAVTLAGLHDALRALEHQAELDLCRAMRRHPLGPWAKATIGIGEKQLARFLAAVDDPAERRTVSQLWAYCGLHVVKIESDADQRVRGTHPTFVGVAPKRKKGQRANWSMTAKMRAYLMAVSCLKQHRSPYREVYLQRRERTAVTHPEWTDGHSHNDALRVAAKAIVRDIWIESRRAPTLAKPTPDPPGGSPLLEAS